MTLEELVGQKLVLGIGETGITKETIELFRKTHAGGLILFRRNFDSAQLLRKLISDLETTLGRKLLVLVDHEGGRVIHLGEGVTIFPDAQALGASGRADFAKRQGEIEALELGRLGIDVNLAPVLDILTNHWNPAIGTRSYGKDPELVASLGLARIQGMQSKGLSACAKHYPGLGEARYDPHRDLPVIQKSWKAMKQSDLVPFMKAFEAGVDCVMSSHPVYPELDPHPSRPATFSRRIIHDSLRLEFGFRGVTLTDDLKMGAISKTVSFREAIPLAVQAGHDLLLVCSDPSAQLEAFNALLWAYKKKDLKISGLEESVERIARLKSKRKERFAGGKVEREKGSDSLAREIARGAAQILSKGRGLLPLSPSACLKRFPRVLFPHLESVAKERFIEPELLEPDSFLKRAFSQFGISIKRVQRISIDPNEVERENIKRERSERDLVFFFCWDAHLFPGARQLLKDLQELPSQLVTLLLREPQDGEYLPAGAGCVTAYGFRSSQIEAAVEKIFSG